MTKTSREMHSVSTSLDEKLYAKLAAIKEEYGVPYSPIVLECLRREQANWPIIAADIRTMMTQANSKHVQEANRIYTLQKELADVRKRLDDLTQQLGPIL